MHWVSGPKSVAVGDGLARLKLSRKFLFLDGEDTRKVLRYENEPTNNDEVGMVLPNAPQKKWTILLSYSPIAYVKDDEADKLDSEALLKSISEATEEDNKGRRANGAPDLHVVGWAEQPHYDKKSHHLIWSIRATANGRNLLNYNTRILGRNGVTSITLVVNEPEFTRFKPNVQEVISHFNYVAGKNYEAYLPGKDTVAEVGLAALVLGGAATAAKTGVLAKVGLFLLVAFKKAWVFLLLGPAAFFKKLFGKKDSQDLTDD